MRVINMAGVDLSVYRFDYDLTFVALLMNADGTIYHTYGGRDHTDAMSHVSMPSFTRVLNETLKDHAAYQKAPAPPKKKKKVTAEDLKRKAKNKNKADCMHCHMIFDFEQQAAENAGKWKRERAFRWPDPVQVGLRLDKDMQNRVAEVVKGSAAHAAGIKAGDVIVSAGAQHVRTLGDLQRALQATSAGAARLPLTFRREDKERKVTIRLNKGWRVPNARTFEWRNSMWHMAPWPGFGGRQLKPGQLTRQGLPEDSWAMRVGYLVTWGKRAYTGRNAAKAGLRKGDIITSVDGKSDFASERHFQSWFRFHHDAGDVVKIELIRGGKRMTVKLRAVD